MSKISYIFIFIFLSAMIFTVVSYIPLLEEEVAHKKIELAKKDNTGGEGCDSSSDDDSEGDSEIDSEKQLHSSELHAWLHLQAKDHFYVQTFREYSFLLGDKNTPPPKI